jgi:hypothetical protein
MSMAVVKISRISYLVQAIAKINEVIIFVEYVKLRPHSIPIE